VTDAPRTPATGAVLPRALLALAIVAAVAAVILFDLHRFASLDVLRAQQQALAEAYAAAPARTVAWFVALYVAITGLSLPGATPLTIVAGAMFGVVTGTAVVSVASTLGATVSFLGSRWLFRDAVQRRFAARLDAINRGIAREGAFYLFALRLVPLVPFFAVNVLMALSPIRAWTFVWVSQVGMFAGTVAYVNAGTELAQIDSMAGVVSPGVLGAFAVLGVLPLGARRLVAALRARRAYRRWTRPRRFDRNLVVIGAGSAGLVAAYIAAAVKARVTLVERDRMGGDCLNTGCVPSKAFLRAARARAEAAAAGALGLRPATLDFDFAEVMARVRAVVDTVAPHDSAERYEALGVECLQGEATITSPWELRVRTSTGEQRLTTRAIVIAAGARPVVPEIPGIEAVDVLTSDTVWDLRALPRRLLVLGGGPIGCELAQAFARFGAAVTLVERLPRLLGREDEDASAVVTARLAADGVDVRTEHEAVRFEVTGGERTLIVRGPAGEARLAFDAVLCAVGRRANVEGYGLETLGLPLTPARTIETNEYLETLLPNVYACGDVAGPYQFTHAGAHQAWHAAVNALFGGVRRFRVDYSVVPWATFTDPEVARVGLSEAEARARDIPYEVTRYGFDDLDRAIAEGATEGFVKVLTSPGRDCVLGATIVGARAGDLIATFVLAMTHGIGLRKLLGTIHVYPTLAEGAKQAAGAWRRARVSPRALRWLARYHAWRRG
jgi:pyruvate/2-oxoglutarate dehydrogenase complex dihydrolipoamide dehydrogenase (E3) component/uncharacterized membrane protein YdjX (TVP38/TMEM64 family)